MKITKDIEEKLKNIDAEASKCCKSKYDVLSLFNNIENLSQEEMNVLKVIQGSLSMKYRKEKNEFCPLFTYENGSTSFSMDDIDDAAAEILSETLPIFHSTLIRAQIAHILWLKKQNYSFAQIAVDEYHNLFKGTFNKEKYHTCLYYIECAYCVAVTLGEKSDSFQKIFSEIETTIEGLDETDKPRFALGLIKLVSGKLSKSKIPVFLNHLDNIIAKFKNDIYIVKEAYLLKENLLKRSNQSAEQVEEAKRMASCYVNFSKQLDIDKAYNLFQAIDYLQEAYNLYLQVKDFDSASDIHAQIEKLQKKISPFMCPISYKFDLTADTNKIKKEFEGLSLQEAIVKLGQLAPIYKKEEIKNIVLKQSQENPLATLFPEKLMDENSHVVAALPSLLTDSSDDTIEKYIIRHIAQTNFVMSILLYQAIEMFQKYVPFSINELDFLIENNKIIPENRFHIIKKGLYVALSDNDFYTAAHILLPQVEHIFRYLVQLCGDNITFRDKNGTETYKPLSELLSSKKFLECYDEDIIFTFDIILNQTLGGNLRNLVAHGLLEPSNDKYLSIFICLLIKFLYLYSSDHFQIITKLSDRDKTVN